MIYHITAAVAWEAAKLLGAYEGDSLGSEGFIHCSTAGQVAGVANGLFRGAEGLVVLHIEVARLASPVKYENLEGGKELFPHVYGPITVDAVEMVTPLRAGPDGEFEFASLGRGRYGAVTDCSGEEPYPRSMTRNMLPRLFLVAALPATLILAAACGGDDDDDDTTPLGSATATVRTERTPTPSPSRTTTTGAIKLNNPTTTASGLKYEDVTVGTGESPKTGQSVTVHYTGTFTNGTKFDSSRDSGRPFTFIIGQGQVIKGWDEGVATMKVGGKRLLEIPPSLGYGSRDYGPIPGNSTLLFEVELLSIK